ncbi:MAG TPA: sterol desaturase family protein [Puia sp.]|nr:sterol desaturase family protein [Puia sp.]
MMIVLLNIFTVLYKELIGFFNIQPVIDMVKSGDYSSLNSLQGIENIIGPVIPFLLLIEIIRAIVYKRFRVIDYKVQFFTYVFNRFIGQFLSFIIIAKLIGFFGDHRLFKTSFTWYWLIYGYIIWEFSHFIYHYLAHKIRLLWCLHSSHHAPEAMNLSVSYAHFILEGPYADLIRNSICLFMGVDPLLLGLIMFIDGTWGAFIHVGENILKDARLGFLNKIILTPSHHRVHHARNPLYMDTNFCNLLNIWDRVFGTLEYEKKEVPVEYGITRKMVPNSFWDMYFGEIVALVRDVIKAPGIKNKLLYLVMPPGWSHTGDHKTAAVVRKEYLNKQVEIQAVSEVV